VRRAYIVCDGIKTRLIIHLFIYACMHAHMQGKYWQGK